MTDAELHTAIQLVRVEIHKAQAQGDLQLIQKHQDELKKRKRGYEKYKKVKKAKLEKVQRYVRSETHT